MLKGKEYFMIKEAINRLIHLPNILKACEWKEAM